MKDFLEMNDKMLSTEEINANHISYHHNLKLVNLAGSLTKNDQKRKFYNTAKSQI